MDADTGNIVSYTEGFGGAIYNTQSSPHITDCVFGGTNYNDGNSSTNRGGAIYNNSS